MHFLKFLASDLDGTLLLDSKKLPTEAKKIFADLYELDVKTALVSARPYRYVEGYAKELQCDYVACNNGAEIYHGGELVYTSRLSGDFVREFTSKLMSLYPDSKIGADYEGVLYANYNMYSAWSETEAERYDLPKYPFPNASKLLVEVRDASELAELSSLISYEDVHLELAHGVAIVTTSNATKENAFKRMAYLSDAHISETAAFGDDIGDIEMLKCAGLGFCTLNGHPMAKKYADKVIDSNDDEGVIKAIKEYFI